MTLLANNIEIRRVMLETARERDLCMSSVDPSDLVYNVVVTLIRQKRRSVYNNEDYGKLKNKEVAKKIGVDKDIIQRLTYLKGDPGFSHESRIRRDKGISERNLQTLTSYFGINYQSIKTKLGNPRGKRDHLIEIWVPKFTMKLQRVSNKPAPAFNRDEFFENPDPLTVIYCSDSLLDRLSDAQDFQAIVEKVRESGKMSVETAFYSTSWGIQRFLLPRHPDLLRRAAPLIEPNNRDQLLNGIQFFENLIRIVKDRHEFAIKNCTSFSDETIAFETLAGLNAIFSKNYSIADFKYLLSGAGATVESICANDITVGDFVMSYPETRLLATRALTNLYAGG